MKKKSIPFFLFLRFEKDTPSQNNNEKLTLDAGLVILYQSNVLVGQPPHRRTQLDFNTCTDLTFTMQKVVETKAQVHTETIK